MTRKTYTIPDCGGGLNLDLLPSELKPGVWSGGSNYIFKDGFAQGWLGMGKILEANRALKWAAPYLTASAHTTIATTGTKVYSYTYVGAETEITRKTDGKVISSLTSTGTTATLVTATAHGLTTGNTVTIYGAAPDAYNVAAVSVTVTDTVTFTYTMLSDPVDTATTKGAYHGSSTADFTAITDGEKCSGGMFNGVFYFNHPTDGLYYYDGTNALRKVPTFASSTAYYKAKIVRFFKDYVLAIYPTEGSTAYTQRVRWSTATEFGALPTAFAGTSTNDSGEDLLTETPGEVVDGRALGDAFVLYTKDARYAMRYIGGTGVFSFQRLPGSEGLLVADCIADYPGGHVFFTPEYDVMIHDGGMPRSIAAGRVRTYLSTAVGLAYSVRAFVVSDPRDNLAYVCFASPSTSSVACDTAMVWSWVSDTWGKVSLIGAGGTAGVYFGAAGLWNFDPAGIVSYKQASIALCAYTGGSSANNGLYSTVDGVAAGSFLGSSLTCTLTRTGLDFGNRGRMKTLHRSRWNFDGSGAITIQHGAARFADTAPTYASGVTYTIGTTDMASARSTQGRFMAVSITGSAKLRSVDLEYSEGGTR